MQPLISVIIPAYNIEEYIERCLKSVCAQTYTNLEIIVVDDGSKDYTGEIIDRIAKEDSRIVPIHKKNAGVSAARNTGLDRATGDYIGFVDGDDIIEEDMYEFLINNALRYDADISHCGYQMVFPDRVDYYYNTGEVRIQDNYQGVYDLIKADKVEPGLWNKLFKVELIGKKRLNEEILINEDLLFNYMIFSTSTKNVYQDKSKYHYMIRKGSASTDVWNIHKIWDPIRVMELILKDEKDSRIKELLINRYVYQLSRLVLFSPSYKREEIKKHRDKAKMKLKNQLLECRDIKLSRKNYLIGWGVVFFSTPLRLLHQTYEVMSGNKNKYKV